MVWTNKSNVEESKKKKKFKMLGAAKEAFPWFKLLKREKQGQGGGEM